METTSNTSTNTRSATRPTDSVQIMAGWYRLLQAEVLVGQLWVEELGSGQSKEHWLLYSNYKWPSLDFPNQSIQFLRETSSISLEDFLHGAPSNAQYIIASCQRQ